MFNENLNKFSNFRWTISVVLIFGLPILIYKIFPNLKSEYFLGPVGIIFFALFVLWASKYIETALVRTGKYLLKHPFAAYVLLFLIALIIIGLID